MLGPEVQAAIDEILGQLDRTARGLADIPRPNQVLADALGEQVAEQNRTLLVRHDRAGRIDVAERADGAHRRAAPSRDGIPAEDGRIELPH